MAVLPALALIALAANSQENVTDAGPGQVLLAPDGEYIAATVKVPGLPGVRNLVTMRLSDSSASAVTGFSDTHVTDFFWANDERLVFSVGKLRDNDTKEEYRGSFSILRDGSGGRKLQQRRVRRRTGNQISHGAPPRLLNRLPTDWNSVLISRIEPSAAFPEVLVLDVLTGRAKRVLASQLSVTRWIVDNSGAVRAAVDKGDDVLDGKHRLLYRDTADGEWRVLANFNDDELEVLNFHADNRRLIVLARNEPGGSALHFLDSSGELSERLFSDPGFDLRNRVGAAGLKQAAQGQMIFYQYMADELRTVYFETRWESRQQTIDEALADTTNTIISWSDDERKLLVHATDSHGASDYYLYDTTYRELNFLQPPAVWVRH